MLRTDGRNCKMAQHHAIDCTCDLCIANRKAQETPQSNEPHNCTEGCTCEHDHTHSHAHKEEGCACNAIHSHEHGHSKDSCGCGHEHTGAFKKYPVRLFVGIGMFVVSILLSKLLVLPNWGSLVLYLAAYLVLGANVLAAAAKNILRGKVFDENFLMTVATIGAFILGEYIEGTAVMLFYLVGETLSDMAVEKSRRSITELMDIRPDYANIEHNGQVQRVSPNTVEVGDIIVIKPYEKVPLDAVVTDGISTLNTSALTGESLPRDIEAGSEILAGCINGAHLIRARVERPYAQSTAARILDIVENSGNRKAHTEKFITTFAKYYTPIVCAAALLVAVVPSFITGEWSVWVYRALLFLVISCPCALVVAVPLSYFGGIGGSSKNGILVKGANYIDALTNVSHVVFDKTGTLTKGVFEVRDAYPQVGIDNQALLAAAAAAEFHSSHPIAKSVLKAYQGSIESASIQNYKDIAGYGVSVLYGGDRIVAGSARLMQREGIAVSAVEKSGTVLYVAKNGNYMGYIVIADSLKEDATKSIAQLKQMGIKTAMLTGDSQYIAEKIASEAGVEDVRSELLPQNKVHALEQISTAAQGVAFVGDGINDAPVLARADVGIAMGALGSDAAIEAADVVLMTDEPSKVPLAIGIAKKTKRIVWQNIIFALAVKAVVMVLGVTGIANMWAAVFADVGVTLLAVLNALRALKSPTAE